jgi:hypothetical protein
VVWPRVAGSPSRALARWLTQAPQQRSTASGSRSCRGWSLLLLVLMDTQQQRDSCVCVAWCV